MDKCYHKVYSCIESKCSPLPTCTQIQGFLECISGQSSLYGLQSETLDSLVLSLLPPLTHSYEPLKEPSVMDYSLDLKVLLMQELLQSLHHCAGINISPVSSTNKAIILSLWSNIAAFLLPCSILLMSWSWIHTVCLIWCSWIQSLRACSPTSPTLQLCRLWQKL